MSSIDAGIGLNGVETSFPVGALLPKAETGVLNFLQKYPEYDGRDVTIAIFDSGVDPRAAGLETLVDGTTVKVIERYDCSGCGDVDMSAKVAADNQQCIKGVSGRSLKLTPKMLSDNIDKDFHIGLKHFKDLCPSKARDNMMKEMKRKEWDAPHKLAIAEATRKLNEFDAQNTDSAKLTWDKKLIKEDYEGTLELLNNYEKLYNDIKCSYDIILYNTANGWQAVIDTTEEGDLANALHIGEYSKTHEVKNVNDYLSVSINVHDNGNVLEVVGMCSPHGTHVAAIASCNHENKELNGIAPNAKIVSLTIGDGRLGSMETGTALVRAMTVVMEMCRSGRRIDVINMSYGEHAEWSNAGRIGELMNEVVNKYGVVWVASAGNHGPGLSTVGTPPDISEPSLIGVGAYVSSQMMEAEYAMREKLPSNVYTWSSRDPCIDGGQGVTICAPGGAITSVPQFTMCKSQLMNGTSMAAPHAAGAIALLISGLKQQGIEYSPYSIKRAVSVTATKLNYVDPFAQGHGLLNVEKAFDHLCQYKNSVETMLRFSLRSGSENAKGIHLREGVLKKPVETIVNIEPLFFNDKETAAEKKFNFNVRLTLVPSHAFVQCGAFLDLSYMSRSVVVKVDPTGLPPGVHSAVIRAFDTDCVQKGSLFEIPITVVQPHVLNCEESRIFEPPSNRGDGSIEFQPSSIQRDMIMVPNLATFAVLRMRSTDKNREKDIGKFFLHTVQLLPKSSCKKLETMKILTVNSDNDTIVHFAVQANNILELCIAKYWCNYGNSHIKYSLEFRGIQLINPNAYIMHAGKGIHKMVCSALVTEDMQPQITLKGAAQVLKPNESTISPLSPTRDVIPEGRQIYQNLLTYTLNVSKAQEVSLYVPMLNSILYESEFESQLWMIFDCNKVMFACGDAHSHGFFTKLEKGEYTLQLQVRHEKRDVLEKISEATFIATFKLSNTLSLDIYDHYNQCVIGGRKFNSCVVKDLPHKVIYAAPLTQEKLNKAALPANTAWLVGSITLPKEENGKRVDSKEFLYMLVQSNNSGKNHKNGSNGNNNNAPAPTNTANKSALVKNKSDAPATAETNQDAAAGGDGGSAPLATNPAAAGAAVPAAGSPKKAKVNYEEYLENLRDFQCTMIGKSDPDVAEKIYKSLIAEHAKHAPLHLSYIQNACSTEPFKQYSAMLPLTFAKEYASLIEDSGDQLKKEQINSLTKTLELILSGTDLVLAAIDKNALLAYYGLKNDTRSDAAKIKTNMDKQKASLLEALTKKGTALAKLGIMNGNLQDKKQELDEIFSEILKFSEATDSKLDKIKSTLSSHNVSCQDAVLEVISMLESINFKSGSNYIAVIHFAIWHAYLHSQYGRMHKYLIKTVDEKRPREVMEEMVAVMGAMKYPHIEKSLQRHVISAYPASQRIF